MKIYQLTYDLRTAEKDYTDLFTFLEKRVGTTVLHVFKDTWWIKYDGSEDLNTICDNIKSHMGENDIFYLAEISVQQINGWMPSSTWKWLTDNK